MPTTHIRDIKATIPFVDLIADIVGTSGIRGYGKDLASKRRRFRYKVDIVWWEFREDWESRGIFFHRFFTCSLCVQIYFYCFEIEIGKMDVLTVPDDLNVDNGIVLFLPLVLSLENLLEPKGSGIAYSYQQLCLLLLPLKSSQPRQWYELSYDPFRMENWSSLPLYKYINLSSCARKICLGLSYVNSYCCSLTVNLTILDCKRGFAVKNLVLALQLLLSFHHFFCGQ